MDRQALITRFEAELGKVNRPGIDKLMGYIRGSDFYTAPASTKYHLAAPGGLLQHSLNVLDALRGLLTRDETGENWLYTVGGTTVATIPEDSVTVMALLYDICKTHFYGTSTRNQKNDATGKWEKVPFYTVDDKMPLGHGPKSAMIVKQYTTLTTAEMYAIWHHMGMTGDYENDNAVGKSIEMFPAVLALHTADMMASRFMEGEKENKPPFNGHPPEASSGAASAGEWADSPATPTGEPEFQEAPPLSEGA